MRISIIVAAAMNQTIGKDGTIPWHLPEDLKRFRKITSGHPIIMGRKTFESIGRALPKRLNLVLTRGDAPMVPEKGVSYAFNLKTAIDMARHTGTSECFIIGGEELYRRALSIADRIYLTQIHHEVEGDTFFPLFNQSHYKTVREEHVDEPFAHTYLVLDTLSKS